MAWPKLETYVHFHKRWFSKDNLKKDVVAGTVLGAQSVPDALTSGLIANVNPTYALYGNMMGMAGAALFTASPTMTVGVTSAMAAIITDVPAIQNADNPGKALFMLSILTGIVMIAFGFAKAGAALRFVSRAVLVGFVTGVGLSIAVGQLPDITGYAAKGDTHLARLFDLTLHFWKIDLTTLAIALGCIALTVLMQRMKLGAISLVLPIIIMSALSTLLKLDIQYLRDVAVVPSRLPTPMLPDFGAIPDLLVPAISLAFVGVIQGAAVSASAPNPDGTIPDASGDFVGQGIGNIVAGVFRGMPVGGSMSSTSILVQGHAATRMAKIFTAITSAIVIVALGRFVNNSAMPALSGLLIIVGYQTINQNDVRAVWRSGMPQRVTMGSTIALSLLLPLQYTVLVGVVLSGVLFVMQQSQHLSVRRLIADGDDVLEVAPPAVLPGGEVVVLQPYGSLFFATAPLLDQALPDIAATSGDSVVVLRLRGHENIGSTLSNALHRYARRLNTVGSELMLVTDSDTIKHELAASSIGTLMNSDHIFSGDEHVGKTTRRAIAAAQKWIDDRPPSPADPASDGS
ncbi:MAG: SulP family inorganic anion transporter [Actinobacteria bacterium]|nr:SulP family inorganic anion transporter [Actinomycetota bacterium]